MAFWFIFLPFMGVIGVTIPTSIQPMDCSFIVLMPPHESPARTIGPSVKARAGLHDKKRGARWLPPSSILSAALCVDGLLRAGCLRSRCLRAGLPTKTDFHSQFLTRLRVVRCDHRIISSQTPLFA